MKSSSFLAGIRQRAFHRNTLLALLIVAVAATGYWAWHTFYAKKNPREMYQVAEVQRGDIEDLVSATGTVQPLEYVDVGAQVSGQLKKLHIEVGSVVKAGELLAEIDPTVFRATVDARRAGLRNQQATMKERESALALANLQFKRQKNLMAADATTAESLQIAEATLRAANAQIEALKAQIEQTQSTLRADEANLNYAKIYAPMDGTVVSLTARQGQTLNANQNAPTILRIADLSTMTVQTQVSEAEIGKLKQGMEVYFTTLGSQGRRWYGALRKVEPTPTVTNNVVLYNALFDVPNRNQDLMPNMTTQVFFIVSSAKDALLVPTAAITMDRSSSNAGARRDRSDGKSRQHKEATDAKQFDQTASATAAGRDAKTISSVTKKDAADHQPETQKEGEGSVQIVAAADTGKTVNSDAQPPTGEKTETPVNTESAATVMDTPASTSGFSGKSATRPRTGTVKLIGRDGKVEQRKVELGASNRVQMQIVSGLSEGETVIIGMKQPATAKRSASGMPPGMAPRGR